MYFKHSRGTVCDGPGGRCIFAPWGSIPLTSSFAGDRTLANVIRYCCCSHISNPSTFSNLMRPQVVGRFSRLNLNLNKPGANVSQTCKHCCRGSTRICPIIPVSDRHFSRRLSVPCAHRVLRSIAMFSAAIPSFTCPSFMPILSSLD